MTSADIKVTLCEVMLEMERLQGMKANLLKALEIQSVKDKGDSGDTVKGRPDKAPAETNGRDARQTRLHIRPGIKDGG
ncbi:MAG: hypothetical protein WC433_01875 [Candidatus Omnitrophota bacterium]|jgi:hypothetical protein